MNNGLSIREKEFEGLTNKEKLTILYQNTEELKKMVKAYKFHQKIQYTAIGVLFILVGVGKFMGIL